jgi:hypothetical protein
VQGACLHMPVLSDVAVMLCNGGHTRWACAKRQAIEAPSTEETRREGVGLAWLSARGCPNEACNRKLDYHDCCTLCKGSVLYPRVVISSLVK